MSRLKTSIAIGTCSLIIGAYFIFQTTDTHDIKQTRTEHKAPEGHSFIEQTASLATKKLLQNLAPESQKVTRHIDSEVDYLFQTTAEYEIASIYGDLPKNLSELTLEKFSYDENGQLIINENIKHIIEFFLMVTQEEGREQAIARLKEYIKLTLPSDAAMQALAIADSYLNYKENLQEHDFAVTSNLSDETTLSKIKSALAEKRTLRRTHLGEELSEIFFDHEERYDAFSLARIEINSDDSLSTTERNQRLEKAEALLPPHVAKQKRHEREETALRKTVSLLKKSSGNDQKIYALRKEFYNEKVADRMAYLEDRSDNWVNKVNQFNLESNYIQTQKHLSTTEKEALIQQSKLNTFTHKERIKLAVQNIRGQVAQLD